MKFSLLSLLLLFLALCGAIGIVTGLIIHDPTSILVGSVLMMLGCISFAANKWRDETSFSKPADKAEQAGED